MSMGVGAFERYYPTPLHPIPPHTLQKLKTFKNCITTRSVFGPKVLKHVDLWVFLWCDPIAMFSCCILCKARGIISNMLHSYGAQDDSVQTFGICRRSRDEICMNIDTKIHQERCRSRCSANRYHLIACGLCAPFFAFPGQLQGRAQDLSEASQGV